MSIDNSTKNLSKIMFISTVCAFSRLTLLFVKCYYEIKSQTYHI